MHDSRTKQELTLSGMVPRSQMANGFHLDSFLHSFYNYLKAFYKLGTVLDIENAPVNRTRKALCHHGAAGESGSMGGGPGCLRDCATTSKLMGKVMVDGGGGGGGVRPGDGMEKGQYMLYSLQSCPGF